MEGFHYAITIDAPPASWATQRLDKTTLTDFNEEFEGTQLERDVTVADVLQQLEDAEDIQIEIEREGNVTVKGYLPEWFHYCLWIEGFLFLLGAARAVGASGRGAFFADDGLMAEYPMYQVYEVADGKVKVDKRDVESDGEDGCREILSKHGLELP
jgi:hypothetical protein